jgi:hypothetical protein
LESAPASGTVLDELAKGVAGRLIGGDGMPGDAEPVAEGAEGVLMLVELLQVTVAGDGGVDVERLPGFDVFEQGGIVEGEAEFSGVEYLKRAEFVTAGGESGEGTDECRGIDEEIGDENDETAFADEICGAFEWRDQVGGATRGRGLDGVVDVAEVTGAMSGGEEFADLVIEGDETDGIALLMEEVGEGGGEGGGVAGLVVVEGAVLHGAGTVEEQVAAEVGLVLELLDVMAVGPGEDPPVEMARVIAGGVLPILGEFDGEAVIGAAMESGPESLDHGAGAEFEAADGHERLGMDEGGASGKLDGAVVHERAGAGTVSRRRWTTDSIRTPSASAR